MTAPIPTANIDLERRRLFTKGTYALIAAIVPLPAWAAAAAVPRKITLLSTHTKEWLDATYWTGAEYDADALSRINVVLRDHRTDEVMPIDADLIELLHTLGMQLHASDPFHVISGYRSPASNAFLRANSEGVARNSLHVKGQAIDIRVPGVDLAHVRRTAVGLRRGGVGYYARSNFVHVDTGRVRFW